MANKKAETSGIKGNFDYTFITDNFQDGGVQFTMKMRLDICENDNIFRGISWFLEDYLSDHSDELPSYIQSAVDDFWDSHEFWHTTDKPMKMFTEKFFKEFPLEFFQEKIANYFLKINGDVFKRKYAPVGSNDFYNLDEESLAVLVYLSNNERKVIQKKFMQFLTEVAEETGGADFYRKEEESAKDIEKSKEFKEAEKTAKKLDRDQFEALAEKLGYELKKPKKATGGRQPICMRKS